MQKRSNNQQCSGKKTKRKGHFSPVDNALIFGHHSLEIGELEKAVMEIVQVEDTHKQEG